MLYTLNIHFQLVKLNFNFLNLHIIIMERIFLLIFSLLSFFGVQSQQLPEFNNKPAFVDPVSKDLVELERSQYNTIAKAKGLFKAEAGFFINGSSSRVKIEKMQELIFLVKVHPGADPADIFDLVQFKVKNDKRIFMPAKAALANSSNSYEKIPYAVKKIKDGYYQLIVKNINEGEYFFGSSEFMFAFSIR